VAAGCITSIGVERDAALNIRLPSEVKQAIRRAADDDHGRSISGMVVKVLREWLAERNYLTLEPAPPPAPRRARKGR
jgi:hypothetical protein